MVELKGEPVNSQPLGQSESQASILPSLACFHPSAGVILVLLHVTQRVASEYNSLYNWCYPKHLEITQWEILLYSLTTSLCFRLAETETCTSSLTGPQVTRLRPPDLWPTQLRVRPQQTDLRPAPFATDGFITDIVCLFDNIRRMNDVIIVSTVCSVRDHFKFCRLEITQSSMSVNCDPK